MKVLVAGGAGYIGTHTLVELIKSGHKVVCVDNLYNSKLSAVKNVEKIVGKKVPFYKVDCLDVKKVDNVFKKEKVDAVIMMQGYKAVGESVGKPLMYYENNIMSAVNLLNAMKKYKVKNVIFSSSATVYGEHAKSPIKENVEALKLMDITNPYGETKAVIEKILMDYQKANSDVNVVILRYFNPVGAHISGLIGEDPNGIPNNLMPYIAKVASGKLKCLSIFGDDYNTKDGTGVRDYIHVVDLAKGHIASMKCFKKKGSVNVYNLGTGKGTSVLELLHAYEKACGHKIKYKIVGRRSGDVAKLYCDPSKANKELKWKATMSVNDMCKTSYLYESNSK